MDRSENLLLICVPIIRRTCKHSMPISIQVIDETSLNKEESRTTLTFPGEYITVEELIYRRVDEEVKQTRERGLVRTTVAEQLLNGPRTSRGQLPAASDTIPIEQRYKTAIDGFYNNAFFVLVNDTQVRDITQSIALTSSIDIRFIKLVPLIGG